MNRLWLNEHCSEIRTYEQRTKQIQTKVGVGKELNVKKKHGDVSVARHVPEMSN